MIEEKELAWLRLKAFEVLLQTGYVPADGTMGFRQYADEITQWAVTGQLSDGG